MKKLVVLSIFVFIGIFSTAQAQTFGFGCLGLSGVFGGYGYQYYKADGLNNYIVSQFPDDPAIDKKNFKRGEGFILGANILQVKFSSLFFGLKGFYQFSQETKTLLNTNTSGFNSYQLNFNYWGAGIDFGFPLGSFVSLKLVDAGVTYSDISLEISDKIGGETIPVMTYKSKKPQLGYYAGSGLIFNIVSNYISLELTARYHFSKYDNIENENHETLLPVQSEDYLIKESGIEATVQLNIGLPF